MSPAFLVIFSKQFFKLFIFKRKSSCLAAAGGHQGPDQRQQYLQHQHHRQKSERRRQPGGESQPEGRQTERPNAQKSSGVRPLTIRSGAEARTEGVAVANIAAHPAVAPFQHEAGGPTTRRRAATGGWGAGEEGEGGPH